MIYIAIETIESSWENVDLCNLARELGNRKIDPIYNQNGSQFWIIFYLCVMFFIVSHNCECKGTLVHKKVQYRLSIRIFKKCIDDINYKL